MKILFSGGSSFTGMWFIQALSQAGHHVLATFQKPLESYQGVRSDRLHKALACCTPIFNCSFGHERFLKLIEEQPIDIYCHHAAEVTNYKAADFDVLKAVNSNTYNIKAVLKALKQGGCNKIVLTGSVFEQNEGLGSHGLRAVSAYGLSKGITADIFRYYCEHENLPLSKFVIANPFGPYEEERFTTYLIKTWKSGRPARVASPDYVRDNIHVSLLSKAYVYFMEKLDASASFSKYNPSGYAGTQKEFAERFACEIRSRLNIACDLEYAKQTDFSEPLIRVNSDAVDPVALHWNEVQAWDELAAYYQGL